MARSSNREGVDLHACHGSLAPQVVRVVVRQQVPACPRYRYVTVCIRTSV